MQHEDSLFSAYVVHPPMSLPEDGGQSGGDGNHNSSRCMLIRIVDERGVLSFFIFLFFGRWFGFLNLWTVRFF